MKNHQWLVWILLIIVVCVFYFGEGATASTQAEIIVNTSGLFSPTTNQLQAAPGSIRSRSVTVDFSMLASQVTREYLLLNLFDDVIYTAVLERVESNSSGSYTWIGRLQGIEPGQVILVVNGKSMVGNISLGGHIFSIDDIGNGYHVIAELDQTNLLIDPTDFEGQNNSNEIIEATQPFLPNIVVSDDGSVIDVMVVYSDDVAATNANIVNEIELAVAYTNQSYQNSDINQRLYLVHTAEVDYVETGSTSLDLSAVRSSTDGIIDQIHSWRNTYHADDVMFIVNDVGCAGRAYVQGNVTPSFQSSAFGVTGNCLSWGTSVFAHEFGHTMGGQHDWFVSTASNPYTYAHGYVDITDRWKTIMSYNNKCSALGFNCTTLPYWSNPNVLYSGAPMGVPGGTSTGCTLNNTGNPPCDADNHRTLNNTAANTAGFRLSQITWTGEASQDWNNPVNWTTQEGVVGSTVAVQRVPRAIDDIYIPTNPTGGRFPILNGNLKARNVTIADSAWLTMTAGTLNVYGNWEVIGNGRFSGLDGKTIFHSPLNQTIISNNDSVFYDVQIGDGTGTQKVSVQSDVDINGNLEIMAGSSLEGGSHKLYLEGNWTDHGNGFAPDTSTVILDGTNQNLTKSNSVIVFNENFSAYDGRGCGCTSALPSGWSALNNGDGSRWWANDYIAAPNGADTAHGYIIRLSGGTTADVWLFSPALQLEPGINYLVQFNYGVSGGTQTISVHYGNANSPAAMSNLIYSNPVVSNTTWATGNGSFTVPSSGIYYLGFRNYDTNPANTRAGIDEISVTGYQDLTFNNLEIQNNSVATLGGEMVILDGLTIYDAAELNLNNYNVSVEGNVNNMGTLSQKKLAPASATIEFLHIKNGASSTSKYLGIGLTPTGNLGDVEVSVTAVDPASGEYCTSDGASSPNYATRCFQINPQFNGTATVRLWISDTELNGLNPVDLIPYRYASGWNQLTFVTRGNASGYHYAQGSTAGFSSFLLGDQNNPPTGIPSITVVPVYGLDLTPANASQGAEPGKTVTYTLQLKNTGNITDSITINKSSSWVTSLSVSNLNLNSGESRSFQVIVMVPAGANFGDMDTATITANSLGGSSQVATLTTKAIRQIFLPTIFR